MMEFVKMPNGKGGDESRGKWVAAVLIAVLVVGLLLTLGGHGLIDPDEGRNAAIALEMKDSGDYLLPTLNQLPFFDKPLLYFAATAVSLDFFGTNEFAARLPALLFALATGFVTAWLADRLFGRSAAWVAGLATVSAPLAIAYTEVVIFDSMLSFFIVLAIVAFFRAVEARLEPTRRHAKVWTLVAWLAMALGVMTKGPVALVVPLLVAAPFALWRRASLAVWHPVGWLCHFAVVIPWLMALEHRVPGFLHYALVTETWGRFTTDQLNRNAPAWYFLPYWLGGLFPWSLIALGSLRRKFRDAAWRSRRVSFVFLLLWIVLPLVFFSLSHSKRPHYILPVVPAVALLSAWVWTEREVFGSMARWAAGIWALAGLLLTGAAWGAGSGALAIARKIPADQLTSYLQTAWLLGASALCAGVAAWLLRKRRRWALAALCLPLLVLPWAAQPTLRQVAGDRSAKDLAAALASRITEDSRIVGIETFSPSLSFYLGRPTVLVSATGRPLTSNYVISHYDQLLASSPGTLRPAGTWEQALESCAGNTFFLLQSHYADERARLRARGAPVLFESRKLVAMGPCRASSVDEEESS